MFRNFGPLYWFTLRSKLRSKAFLTSTILTLVFIFAFANIDRILSSFDDDEQGQALLVTQNIELTSTMQSLGYEDVKSADISEDEAREGLSNGDYNAVAFIDGYSARVLSERPETEFTTALQTALREVRNAELIEESNIDPNVVASLNEPIPIEESYIGRGGETSDEIFSSITFVYIMLFLLYISIIVYGSMISTEVTTEKSSRVMELIISTTHPVTHMLTKIIAIGSVALLQLLLFIGFGYFSAKNSEAAQSIIESSGQLSSILYLLVFFVLGYLLYASIFAVLGSLVNRVEDSQQLALPVTSLLVVGFVVAIYGLNSPDASIVTALSFVPFFTPMLMFLRVMLVDVPVWEVILSIGIMVASISVILWIGSKFYRGGVLFYGNNPLKHWKQILQNRQ